MGHELYGGLVASATSRPFFPALIARGRFVWVCVGGGVRFLLARLTARADARCDVVLSPDAARLGEPRTVCTLPRARRRDLAERAR